MSIISLWILISILYHFNFLLFCVLCLTLLASIITMWHNPCRCAHKATVSPQHQSPAWERKANQATATVMQNIEYHCTFCTYCTQMRAGEISGRHKGIKATKEVHAAILWSTKTLTEQSQGDSQFIDTSLRVTVQKKIKESYLLWVE